MSTQTTAAEPRRRRALIWLIVGVGIVVVAVLAVAAWIGVRGGLAKSELEAAADDAAALQSDVLGADVDGAEATAESLVRHTSAAAGLTGDPVWRAAEVLPLLGDDLRAVRVLADQLDRAAEGAIRPLAGLTEAIYAESFRPVDGRIDVRPLVEARPTAHAAALVLAKASSRVDAVESDGLLGPVADARDRLAKALDKGAALSQTLDNALAVAPTMLGAEGPRNFLVLFQNNAELRSAGGIPGAFALIHVEDGLMQLVAQASTTDFSSKDGPSIAIPDATTAVFGTRPGTYIQDVTMTPDFTVSAAVAKQMWERRFGGTVDGVIAVDPVALSYLLGATGPVALADGSQLTEKNAVQSLLVDVYHRLPSGPAQDAYFADAAAASFSAISAGKADPRALVTALARAGDEHRISLWSTDAAQQAILAGTTLAGLEAAQEAMGPQTYGVYLNDGTGSKIDPYLDVALAVGATPRDDGLSDVRVQVTLTSTAAADAGTTYPPVVTGTGFYGVPPGQIATNVTVYAPKGAFDGGLEHDGTRVAYAQQEDSGHLVSSLGVTLAPGESTTLVFHYTSAARGQDAPILLHTPLMRGLTVGSL
ncbi:MAG: DUF4012 domain-containing protein [Leifsonia sp.]